MTLTHHPAPAHRRARTLATGAAAALLLTGLIVGIPAVLLAVAPRGLTVTSWDRIHTLLTGRDDGTLFLAALLAVAWIAWAVFTLSVVLEAVALIRRVPTPRIPLLAGPQQAAASLIAAIALLAPQTITHPTGPATSITATTTTRLTGDIASAAATRSATPTPAAPRPRLAASAAAPVLDARTAPQHLHGYPTVTVHRGDTLWGIAEDRLGSGARYREIARLNYGRPPPDGRTLTESNALRTGWILLLPGDAHAPRHPQPHAGDQHATQSSEGQNATRYVVRPGDNLWEIAATQLGDPMRYRDIYRLNRDRPQDDGRSLTDPQEIMPGWVLLLPPRHATHVQSAPTTTQSRPPRVLPVPPRAQPTASPVPSATSVAEPAPPHPETVPGIPSPGASSAGVSTHDANAVDGRDGARSDQSVVTPVLEDSSVPLGVLALGLSALAATGVVAELARRRRRRQSTRIPGQRLPHPDVDAADAEAHLHGANDPVTLETLTTALAQLTENARTSKQSLPAVQAILVSNAAVDLLVADHDQPPVPPFVAGAPGRWRLDPADLRQPGADEDHAYPALVSAGTVHDAILLLNLEAAGTLSIEGSEDACHAWVRSLAVELATSPLATGLTVMLPNWLDDLAEVTDPDRGCAVTADAANRRAIARTGSVATLLDDAGAHDLLDARTRSIAHDTWTPEIVITEGAIVTAPWCGVATITLAPRTNSGWHVHLEDDRRARLDPIGLQFQPTSLGTTDYRKLLALLNDQELDRGVDLRTEATRSRPALVSRRAEVLRALPTPQPRPATTGASGPRLLLLGRPEVDGHPVSPRRARCVELLIYLMLHPGATSYEIDEALWPGKRVTEGARNSFVSRTRAWLGTDDAGHSYLPLVRDQGSYQLVDVTSDWHDFLHLARRGLEAGPTGLDDLAAALALVRGRPLMGVDPASYAWAEVDIQEMVSAVVDVAYETAVMFLQAGDYRGVARAVGVGIATDPANELLHEVGINAAERRGDHDEASRLRDRERAALRDLDPDSALVG